MITVNKSQVSLEDGKIVGEASTMGLAPGEWPDFIAVVDDSDNGFLFQRADATRYDGDLASFRYLSTVGNLEMVVLND